ncbi:MAG TPA: hypothetical protein VF997_17370 [Polyangia bacterium]
MRTRSLVALAALVTGCGASPRYAYRPTAATALSDAPGDVAGAEAASYPVPRVVARGDLEVATLGPTTTRLPGGHGTRAVRALHVRMVVHNGSGEVWMVDAADQRATIDGAAHLPSAFARCDGEAMAQAVLEPGDKRTIDLYYELPPRLADAAAIPSVRVEWRVATPSGALMSESSAFERHELPPAPQPPSDPKQLARELVRARVEWPSWR